MKAASKLSPSQLSMLRNIAAGKEPTAGLFGMSAHGGATQTLHSLRRRGLVSVDAITDAGRAVLAGATP